MRLADLVLRQGHLSDNALTEAILTATRPAHLDSCDLCSRRALQMGRWLDDIRADAIDAADAAFPAERLAAQQSQILRRLEQIDQPPRVIAFPATAQVQPRQGLSMRRVSPAWVGVAAAAGLVVGVISGQMSARLDRTPLASPEAGRPAAPVTEAGAVTEVAVNQPFRASLLELDLDGLAPGSLQGIDDITPSLVRSSYNVAQRR